MSTFLLPGTKPEASVAIAPGVELQSEELLAFPAFKTWLSTLKHSLSLQQKESHAFHLDPYALRRIEIQSIDRFGGGRLGFMKLKAEINQ